MKIEVVAVSSLINWDKNPRSITKVNFKKLKEDLQRDNFAPLVVNQDNIVLSGNQRLRAIRELGWGEVEISRVETRSEEDMVWYALRGNESSGEWDLDKLAELTYDLPEFDNFKIDLKNITLDKLKKRYGPEPIEDEPPPVPDEPESKRGEIYELGRHRLMCGDATSREDVEKLMDGKKADMVFTDPPYGVSYEGRTKDKLTIRGDGNTEVFGKAVDNFLTVPGAAFYVCCPAGNNFKDFLIPFTRRCYHAATIVWVKNSLVLGHGDYHYRHEPILYGWSRGAGHKFYGDRTQTTVWEIDKPSVSKEHPTMKPVAVPARAIKNSSKKGDIVLDLFGGSGSTLIACEQTNRICYMMEIDPRYCDVIRKRYEVFTRDS